METRKKIIRAAETLFMNLGIRSVTMDDIAKKLSISKKTIYESFRDKEEIVYLVTKNHLEREKGFVKKTYASTSNAIEKIFLVSKFFGENIDKIHASVLIDLRKYYPKSWELYMDFKTNFFVKSLKNTLEQGVKEAYFRKSINTNILAILRLEEVQLVFDKKIFPFDNYPVSEVHMQLFTHFMYGIVTDKGKVLLEKYFKKKKESL